MAPSFLKNLFGSKKTKGTVERPPDGRDSNAGEVPLPVPPERKLSLSKSGKMRRKNYNRQVTVIDKSIYKDPRKPIDISSDASTSLTAPGNVCELVRDRSLCSTGVDEEMDAVVEELMETAKTTRV